MMKFIHPVTTFSTTGKSAKGKALQEMALKFDRCLIHGDSLTISNIVCRMREIAEVLDARYPRTRPTLIDWVIDDEGTGQISAKPSNDGVGMLDKDYFRIAFTTVAHSATIDEVIDRFNLNSIEKGGDA